MAALMAPLPPCAERERPEDAVRARVWSLLSGLYPRGELVERRRERRYPYPYLVRLEPVGDDGLSPDGEAIVVVGKHLSERGLGFYHPRPLPYRRMIATLETGNGAATSLLVDLTWCRFTRQGWYESGGKFLQSVARPDL